MPVKCAVIVNLDANNGRAARRWERTAAGVAGLLPQGTRVIPFHPPADIRVAVKGMLDDGFTMFVSAGGDGSVNYLLNLLMELTGGTARQLYLGGIGLGSSNDFIKPARHFIDGVPIRLDDQHATPVDVGKATFVAPDGSWQTRYFIANASLGVTAEANWFFNNGDWFIRMMKNRWTGLAILYAALRTILGFRNFPVLLDFEHKTQEVMLSNLAVLKSPYVSGSFHFDDPVLRNDGLLGVNACLNMKKTELIGTLAGLAKGRFRGRPKTMSQAVKQFSVQAQSPVALEMDGEVFQTSEVVFSVLPEAIKLMAL